MNILVLDGNQNQAVASVRSLARAGHTVFAGEAASWSKASWSRACLAAFRYPSPKGPIDAFLQAIAAFVREMPGTLVLPMTELTTLLLSAHRDFVISAGARLVLPDHSDLLRAFDKSETTRLAASLGIAVPKTVLVTNPEQALEAAQCMRFPVVLKPLASEQLSPDGNLRTAGRPRYARSMTAWRCVSAGTGGMSKRAA
jgi:predicted ATP-grasp superfamily ATP-dependent carboligase